MASFVLVLGTILVAAASAFVLPAPKTRISICTSQLRLSSLATTVDIRESAQRDIPSLYEWGANYGVQTADSYELQSDDGSDIYATSNQNLPADTPVVCVPSDLILTGNKARMEFGTEASAAERTLKLADHPTFYLFLKVLKEWEMGDQSPWYGWLNSLPRFFANAASMTDFCFSCLPPYAAKQSQLEKQRLQRYENALDEVAFLSYQTKSNPELIKWAYNVVHTRYQEKPGGDYALLPMADYFNHGGTEVDVYISYDDDGNGYAYTTREVQAGEPLRIRYTDPTNPSQTLARYGFLDESSPGTYCKWIAEQPKPEMFELGYPSRMLFYNDGGISNEIYDVLLYDELGKIDPGMQQAFYQACASSDEATKSNYHGQYFAQTIGALQAHVSYILQELDDRAVWERTAMDIERHPRLPLIMDHNHYVMETFMKVQQNIASMSS